jgi:hypothetical protein
MNFVGFILGSLAFLLLPGPSQKELDGKRNPVYSFLPVLLVGVVGYSKLGHSGY